ncbi:pentatricopeptide repeat-containing protein [Tanacetum coccineum]
MPTRLKSVRGHMWYRIADDVIEEGAWKWQPTWIHVHVPTITPNVEDILFWRDINGNLKEFSVSSVWDVIRPRKVELSWLRVVWYSQCIPLRAFLLWLIMLKKLKTHDLLRQWDVSHFSLEGTVAGLIPISRKSLAIRVSLKDFVVAASSCFIWQERNNCIFKKGGRKVEQLRDVIVATVRFKLMSLHFKSSASFARCLAIWQIPKYLLSNGV